MPSRTTPVVTLSVTDALDRSEPLAHLLERLRRSRALWTSIQPMLPTGLDTDVRPGSLDTACWTLLAANGSVAAKLRQLAPRLLAHLQQQGWQGTSIKVRVQPRDAPARPVR